jgi:hypothetical protein
MVVAAPETVSQLSPVEIELIVITPPPAFCSPRTCEDATGFELKALNESIESLRLSCGGGAETVNVTVIVSSVSGQALMIGHATRIVAE